MLSVSRTAADAIKLIVSASPIPAEGGIRLAAEPIDEHATKLELSLVETPEPGDAIVEEEGAKVFVEQNTAVLLDGKVLDATVEQDGVSFSISDQQDWSQNGRPKNVDPGSIS